MRSKRNYSNQIIDGQICVWLQAHGWQPAILGRCLKVGDVLMYNFGGRGEIVSVDKETAKTITISVKSLDGGDLGKVYSDIRICKDTYKPIAVTSWEKRGSSMAA